MTQEEKDLLLKDLCARLPYGVICRYEAVVPLLGEVLNYGPLQEIRRKGEYFTVNGADCLYEDVKPYLRPMSSMTEDEKEELLNLLFDKESKNFYIDEEGFIDGKTSDLMKDGLSYPSFCPINIVLYTDWLNAHHFDYRGLIEKGLALEAPE